MNLIAWQVVKIQSNKKKGVFKSSISPTVSSGDVKTLEKSGKNPEAKIRREVVRLKSGKIYNDREKNTVGRSLQKTFRTRYKYWFYIKI